MFVLNIRQNFSNSDQQRKTDKLLPDFQFVNIFNKNFDRHIIIRRRGPASVAGISCKRRKLEKRSFSTFSKIINHIKLFSGNISLDGSNKVLLTIKSEAKGNVRRVQVEGRVSISNS